MLWTEALLDFIWSFWSEFPSSILGKWFSGFKEICGVKVFKKWFSQPFFFFFHVVRRASHFSGKDLPDSTIKANLICLVALLRDLGSVDKYMLQRWHHFIFQKLRTLVSLGCALTEVEKVWTSFLWWAVGLAAQDLRAHKRCPLASSSQRLCALH